MEDQNRTMGAGNNQSVPVKASFGDRFGACLIDHVIITVILMVPFALILFRDLGAALDRMPALLLWLVLAACFAYGLRDIGKGRSLGKRAVGIAVRDRVDPSKVPSIPRLFLRNIFIFLWPIDVFVLVCGAKRTKIGDKLAGTDVYRIPQKRNLPIIIITAVLAFVMLMSVFVGGLFFGVTAILRNHPSHEVAISYIETNQSVTEIVGEIEQFGMRSGSISHSGRRGQAEYMFRVVGSDNTLYVYILLETDVGGEWGVVDFYYRR